MCNIRVELCFKQFHTAQRYLYGDRPGLILFYPPLYIFVKTCLMVARVKHFARSHEEFLLQINSCVKSSLLTVRSDNTTGWLYSSPWFFHKHRPKWIFWSQKHFLWWHAFLWHGKQLVCLTSWIQHNWHLPLPQNSCLFLCHCLTPPQTLGLVFCSDHNRPW